MYKAIAAFTFLSLIFGNAFAQGTESFSAADNIKDTTKIKVPAKDLNGDGFIEKNEVDPNSQLAKRFSTRDKDGDGKLSKDEYFVP